MEEQEQKPNRAVYQVNPVLYLGLSDAQEMNNLYDSHADA